MSITTSDDLQRLDLSLTRLRRLWDSPAVRRRLTRSMGADVEPSLVRTLRAIERTELDAPGVNDVAEVLAVDDSTASRLVDQAVNAGMVTRTTAPHDRRRTVLRLTDSGTAVLTRALQARTELLQDLTAGWSARDVAALTELLGRFTAAVTEAELRS